MKKENRYYFPMGCEYVVGYYDNTDGAFIFDRSKYEDVSKHHWSDKNTKNRHEPITAINGKTTSMARYLLNTPDGLECDHINGIPNDNRLVNLRNCTHLENCQNRSSNKSDLLDTGEYSFKKSQEIAKMNESLYFNDSFFYTGMLGEIYDLPEKNIFKIRLKEIGRRTLEGILTEENIMRLLLQLMKDYLNYKEEDASA